MEKSKKLKINGMLLEKSQLENYLEKIASSHNITLKSEKETYPIPFMMENFEIICETYNLLNEHLKLGINIHPAGEWLLDNFYIIEEIVKQIKKEMPLKKYMNFVGISNGEYKGFARIYVIATEIIAYSEGKIERKNISDYIQGYQKNKLLNMDEIWNIGIFMQIALIEKIANVCKKVLSSQIEKYKAESIAERFIENKEKSDFKFKLKEQRIQRKIICNMKYPFIEYMSYILKRYGKKANIYLNTLEEIVEKLGTTVSEIIKKEHFEIAIEKVLMGNCITSIKEIQRIDFLEVFEKINGVEEILKSDPVDVYNKMDYKTKEYYRARIKEISTETKISEIYIAKKTLEIAKENLEKEGKNKKAHIGYYLIDEGINILYKKLGCNFKKEKSVNYKTKRYIFLVVFLSIVLSLFISYLLEIKTNNIPILYISFFAFLIPSSEVVIQISQYILSKIVKPKLIPKIDLSNGINKENSCMVVIPTILDSKEKVITMFKNLEKYYLANKSENIYFTLLGDCTQSSMKELEIDFEIIEEGKKQANILNKKYEKELEKIGKEYKDLKLFNFIYRERIWNEKENCYLGWERKRGLLNQFNDYIIYQKNVFRENTIEENLNEKSKEVLKNIKYVITLDSDTDLILNSAFELVGAMAHILNKPVINKELNIVTEGYGIMQPRVGVNLDVSLKTMFTKIFAGAGGIDGYTNAISDIYQDNFDEGIFTGKGIYDVKIFSKILKDRIPENTVLSHDLLEGCYLRCGLLTDVLLMDGYPTRYMSFMNRLSRWIRGDWQIIKWLDFQSPLNLLSKYKIFDNLRRSLFEFEILKAIIYIEIIRNLYNTNLNLINVILIIISIFPYLLEMFNNLIGRKEGEEKQKAFTPKISGIKGILLRSLITFGSIPYKAYISLKSIVKTLYRLIISHKNMLEWTTSEDAEKQAKKDILSYNKNMIINIVFGILEIVEYFINKDILSLFIGAIWIIIPSIMWYISIEKEKVKPIQILNNDEKKHLLDIGRSTWEYFKKYLNEENNYLIPDNYQEDRKNKIVKRTSSTNIGLSLLATISANDLGYIDEEESIDLIEKIVNTINQLQKWNGHLYNWYNTENREPLSPKYISTVDSGNFIGYLYVLKTWLEEKKEKEEGNKTKERIENILNIVKNIIQNTNFSYLYSESNRLFSIGFNIEENKLTNSYYDLLASEARQASLIAIAKRDIPSKHWNCLSRTLTTLGKYKGLISWSGTSFEYLMPNINIPKYEGSLLDESCKFMIMTQIEYAKKLQIPWGISEAAFNLKDLQSNYQYKAFGIPWLGLKRGLADEMVVSSYGSIMAITDFPKEVYQNIKKLEEYGMLGEYGFYESIDFTPGRVEKGKKASVVKTYMAHHQSLILLSINNLFNDNILQKRFMKNPEIQGIEILLQERMPETSLITKENKEKIEKIKYIDYENYIQETYKKVDQRLIRGNVISSNNYTIAMNQKGEGVSIYNNKLINRYKKTEDFSQGIFWIFQNIKSKAFWSSASCNEKYQITFMPDKIKQEILNENIKTTIQTIVAPDEPLEIRNATLENMGNEEEIIEITTYFEPVLSIKEQDYAHPAFNNLFLMYDYDVETNSIIIKRKERENGEELYMCSNLSTNCEIIGDIEYEIDGEKFKRKIKFWNTGNDKRIKTFF